MDNKNVSVSVPKAAVLVGLGLVLVGIGLLVYLLLSDAETATETAVRPTPVPETVATESPVGGDSLPETVATEPPVGGDPTSPATPPTTSAVEPGPSAVFGLEGSHLRWLEETEVGSGSSEFSAVALNEGSNRLMVADDENRLFEYDLATDGTLILPPRRMVRVTAGAGDIEGIAWMFENTYVLAHENDGRLTIVEIADDSNMVSDEDVVRTVDTGIREVNGNGLEGVAYLGSISTEFEFAVVDERPATLYLLSGAGTVASTIELDLPDASDVWANTADSIVVLSDDGRVVVGVTISSDGTAEIVDRLSLVLSDGQFEQPEGLVGDRAGTRLYVVGELPGPSRYSFGLWTTESPGDG